MGTPNNAPNQFETPGTKGYVLGWGAQSEVFSTVPNMLQGVQIPIIGLEECKKQVPKWQYEVVDERSICGGYPQGGKDACSGDSGGPYVTLDVCRVVKNVIMHIYDFSLCTLVFFVDASADYR